MPHDLLSVEQVAELLGLHVRTIRSYVRDGRLKATRVGKQYRIARADLEAFTGHQIPAHEPPRRSRHIDVSSVVAIDAISRADADRVSNTLMAAVQRPVDQQPLRVDAIYDEVRGSLKVIIVGSLETSTGLLRLVAALTNAEER